MTITGSIQARDTYLYVEVGGTFEIKQAKQLTQNVLDTVFEYNLPKILFDARQLKGGISIMQRFEYGTFLSSTLLKVFASSREIRPKMAVVADKSILDSERFVELVARNRGAVIKVTDNIDEAYEWLGEKPSEPTTSAPTPITDIGEN